MVRTDFTDKQKADIFVLDRATCGYTGRSLWLLDHGIGAQYTEDWIDHILPASKGGPSEVENGVCSCSYINFIKRDASDRPPLFWRCLPQFAHFFYFDEIPEKAVANFLRFRRLHFSDWYFNKALAKFFFGMRRLSGEIQNMERDEVYYARAALNKIEQWRELASKEHVPSFEERKLIPAKLTDDRKLLLQLRDVGNEEDILRLMKKAVPFHKTSQKALFDFFDLLESKSFTLKQLDALVKRIKNNRKVSADTKQNICRNAQLIKKYY